MPEIIKGIEITIPKLFLLIQAMKKINTRGNKKILSNQQYLHGSKSFTSERYNEESVPIKERIKP
tara:strand:+ start:241 stop:435 length:195 start_codon:yes stop_codon:yes gene_type:complete